jgi:hypothetical protein
MLNSPFRVSGCFERSSSFLELWVVRVEIYYGVGGWFDITQLFLELWEIREVLTSRTWFDRYTLALFLGSCEVIDMLTSPYIVGVSLIYPGSSLKLWAMCEVVTSRVELVVRFDIPYSSRALEMLTCWPLLTKLWLKYYLICPDSFLELWETREARVKLF